MDPDPHDRRDDEAPAQASLAPFLAALVLVGVAAVLAFVFLRSEDEGRLVRPDRLDATGDASVRAVVFDVPGCERIDRAQVDFDGDERVLLELVAVEIDGCEGEGGREVVAEVELPRPIEDRALAAGVGRIRLPCTGDGASIRCAAER
ncbi:MAG: hypothetical protein ACLGIC_08855 [Acidimicrobiia bacterium]